MYNYRGQLTLINSVVLGSTAAEGDKGASAPTDRPVNSVVSGNTIAEGALANYQGTLTLIKSTVSHNTATGGGISNDHGMLTLTNSTVSYNTATGGSGGGISNTGTLTLTNSTVSYNTATVGDGGGIASYGGTITLSGSTVSNNRTIEGNGGGISNESKGSRAGILRLTNSTLFGNRAEAVGSYGGYGGSLFIKDSEGSVVFCTIDGNTAAFGGGGVAIVQTRGTPSRQVAMGASIIADDHATVGPDIFGDIASSGYNLIQNIAQATLLKEGASRDILGVSPLLAALQQNGGVTQTQAFLPVAQQSTRFLLIPVIRWAYLLISGGSSDLRDWLVTLGLTSTFPLERDIESLISAQIPLGHLSCRKTITRTGVTALV